MDKTNMPSIIFAPTKKIGMIVFLVILVCGLGVRFFDLTDPPPGDPIELPPVIELDSVVAGLGIVGEYDSRDDQFNAYKGNHFEVLWSVADQAVGSDFDSATVRGRCTGVRRAT